jgi:hypothetical protein
VIGREADYALEVPRWLPLLILTAACSPGSRSIPDSPGEGEQASEVAPEPALEPAPAAAPEPAPAPAPEPEPEPEPEPAASSPEPPGLRGVLAAHNRYRARHCAPPLEWSAELAKVAQKWARTLRDRSCAFEHSPSSRYGENLAGASPPGAHTGVSMVDGWYREVDEYDFGRPGFSFEAGHFTQLVWRATRRLGCGHVTCGDRAEIWVCNYDPPGNVSREFKRNVLPTSCRK